MDDNGEDRSDLDPEYGSDFDGWWICHKDTKRGDLALLWRTTPRRDVGYLMQARSDAFPLEDDPIIRERGWTFACDNVSLKKFKNPVTLAEVQAVPYLEDWGALRGNFQRSFFAIPDEHWARLVRLIVKKNPDSAQVFHKAERGWVPERVLLEEDIENQLAEKPSVFRKVGLPNLEFRGRQVICSGRGGRIDLLYYDRSAKCFVVVELKNTRAGRNTFGQIASYLGWVTDHFPSRKKPIGIVLARGADHSFLDALETNRRVQFVELKELGFL